MDTVMSKILLYVFNFWKVPSTNVAFSGISGKEVNISYRDFALHFIFLPEFPEFLKLSKATYVPFVPLLH